MHLSEQLNLSHEQYGVLFDVRRSVRYHDRRRGFYEQLHHFTSLLTILMAGSVFFDLAKPGDTAEWLKVVSALAAILAAMDMVVGYSKRAALHGNLRERFAMLEIAMIDGDTQESTWLKHQRERLLIEKDEPPIYKVLDNLCRNELLETEGYTREKAPEQFFQATTFQRMTAQFFRWENATATKGSGDEKQAKTESAIEHPT